jgi:poly(A) polymerase
MELKRILPLPDPVATVALMAETGVLGAVLPEARAEALAPLVARGAPADALLRLAAMVPAEAAAAVARRLRFSAAEAGRLAALGRLDSVPRPGAEDVALRRALAEAGEAAAMLDRIWLVEAREDGDPAGWEALRARIAALEVPVFPLLGRDLLAEGVPPGPAVGRLLGALREYWLAGGCVATREEMLAEARRRL